ncbi:hypothetical protein Salat_2559900 [Sesamum alatum]|uniref:Uncharacterized protein n=1 Tax=Sesamum alatum TaxID=300844 RepID=A0AAE1XTM7_9LAMI|nr:hypothetical protein Salat_2559900 [Sesamum alatum]
MLEEENLFNFLSRLQAWAQTELRTCLLQLLLQTLDAFVAEADEDGSFGVNPLQLLSAMQEKPPKQKDLMYIWVQVNGKEVRTMVDTGTTHNFVADREIQKLGLYLTQHFSRIKAVKYEAKPIQGVASVELKLKNGLRHGYLPCCIDQNQAGCGSRSTRRSS